MEHKTEQQSLFPMDFKEMQEVQFILNPNELDPHKLQWIDGIVICPCGISTSFYRVASKEGRLVYTRHYTEMRSIER